LAPFLVEASEWLTAINVVEAPIMAMLLLHSDAKNRVVD